MITLDRQHAILYGAVFVLAIAAVYGWEESRADVARMQSTLDAQKQVIAQAQQQRDSIAAAESARDAATAKELEAMQSAVSKIQTPQQIASWIPQQLQVPQPITFNVPPATAANPNPPATATIPSADLPAIRDQISQCQQCAVKLETAQQDVASKADQLRLATQQLSAVSVERDAAIKAAKGGSFWQRTGRILKWFAVGAASGYVIAKTVK